MELSDGAAEAVRVKDADLEIPAYAAVMVADIVLVTDAVVTANPAETEPCATVTEPGVVTLDEESERVTTTLPLGAARLSVTEQKLDDPDVTVAGLH